MLVVLWFCEVFIDWNDKVRWGVVLVLSWIGEDVYICIDDFIYLLSDDEE